eukprot:TRINITY_DN17568_c1_g1_i1.p1 TRINITY_DN17568_c1_g1~~TRINITY_DN17568_c1_g1_i1.p1  ORF type:complete len:374 (-),score=93.17 TRINITY_DN17568_c1_g1_i1:321-1442(-)
MSEPAPSRSDSYEWLSDRSSLTGSFQHVMRGADDAADSDEDVLAHLDFQVDEDVAAQHREVKRTECVDVQTAVTGKALENLVYASSTATNNLEILMHQQRRLMAGLVMCVLLFLLALGWGIRQQQANQVCEDDYLACAHTNERLSALLDYAAEGSIHMRGQLRSLSSGVKEVQVSSVGDMQKIRNLTASFMHAGKERDDVREQLVQERWAAQAQLRSCQERLNESVQEAWHYMDELIEKAVTLKESEKQRQRHSARLADMQVGLDRLAARGSQMSLELLRMATETDVATKAIFKERQKTLQSLFFGLHWMWQSEKAELQAKQSQAEVQALAQKVKELLKALEAAGSAQYPSYKFFLCGLLTLATRGKVECGLV